MAARKPMVKRRVDRGSGLVAGRFAAGVLEQGTASLSTLAVSIATARVATTDEFGAIANLMAVHFLWLAVVRSLTTTPILLYGVSHVDARRTEEDVLAASATLALMALPVFVAVGALSGEPLLGLAVGITSMALCVWDGYRYYNIAALRPKVPLVSGVALLGAVVATCGMLMVFHAATAMTTTLAWLGSMIVVMSFVTSPAMFRSPLAKTHRVLRRNQAVGVGLSLEALLAAGASQFVVFAMSVFASLQWSAGFRAVTTIALGPLTTLLMGLTPQLQLYVRTVATGQESARRYRFTLGLVACGLAVIGSLYVLALNIVPRELLAEMSGESWKYGSQMAVSTVILVVASAAATVILGDVRYRWGPRGAVLMRAGATAAGLAIFTGVTLAHGGDPRLGLTLYGASMAVLPLLVVLSAQGKPQVVAIRNQNG